MSPSGAEGKPPEAGPKLAAVLDHASGVNIRAVELEDNLKSVINSMDSFEPPAQTDTAETPEEPSGMIPRLSWYTEDTDQAIGRCMDLVRELKERLF